MKRRWIIAVAAVAVIGAAGLLLSQRESEPKPAPPEGASGPSEDTRTVHYFRLDEESRDDLPGPLAIFAPADRVRPVALVDGSLVFAGDFVDALSPGGAPERLGLSPASAAVPFEEIGSVVEHRIAYRGVGRNDTAVVVVLLPDGGGTIARPEAPEGETLTLAADELVPALYGVRLWHTDLELRLNEAAEAAAIVYGGMTRSLPLVPQETVALGSSGRELSMDVVYVNPIPKGPPQPPTIGRTRLGPHEFSTTLSITYLGAFPARVRQRAEP